MYRETPEPRAALWRSLSFPRNPVAVPNLFLAVTHIISLLLLSIYRRGIEIVAGGSMRAYISNLMVPPQRILYALSLTLLPSSSSSAFVSGTFFFLRPSPSYITLPRSLSCSSISLSHYSTMAYQVLIFAPFTSFCCTFYGIPR